jgi:hypothetical protein
MWDKFIVGSNLLTNANGVLKIDGHEQVTLERGQNSDQLLVSVDVHDAEGKRLAKLRRNAWVAAQDRVECSSSPSSLTLTDRETNEVVFEAQVVDTDTVVIKKASFYDAAGKLVAKVTPEALQVRGATLTGNHIQGAGQAFTVNSRSFSIGTD